MTAPESFIHRFADWFHSAQSDVERRLAKVEAELAALKVKDAPTVEKDVHAAEAVAAQDVKDAATLAADAEKAAGV